MSLHSLILCCLLAVNDSLEAKLAMLHDMVQWRSSDFMRLDEVCCLFNTDCCRLGCDGAL